MLSRAGFGDCEVIDIDREHQHGPAILLACESKIPTISMLQKVEGGIGR